VSKQNPVSVSVVVAAYGDVPYLEETLQSLIVTQPDSVPIYVLDDCSPTTEVHEIAQRFSNRITYIRSEVNRGVSGSFNAAADLVDTEYLMLVGPDDRVTRSLEDFLHGVNQEAFEAVVIQPGVSVIDSVGAPVWPINDRVKNWISPKEDAIHSGESLAVSFLKGDWAYNPSLLWKVSYLRESRYDESLKTAMDLDILLRLTFEGKSLYLSGSKVFEYRRHSEAVSSKNAGTQQFGEELAIHKRAFESSKSQSWNAAMKWAKRAPTSRLHALQLALTPGMQNNRELILMIWKGIKSS
jgi:glycosyltransferase involved in cell wall biosynthesis